MTRLGRSFELSVTSKKVQALQMSSDVSRPGLLQASNKPGLPRLDFCQLCSVTLSCKGLTE